MTNPRRNPRFAVAAVLAICATGCGHEAMVGLDGDVNLDALASDFGPPDVGADGGLTRFDAEAEDHEAPPPDSGPLDAGACQASAGTANITGTWVDSLRSESATIAQPKDLSQLPFSAWVWTGACFASFPGAGTSSGSFSVSGLPSGELYLRYPRGTAPRYVWRDGSAASIDLGESLLGGPGLVPAAGGTSLQLQLSGLLPWQSFDDLEIYAPDASVMVYAAGFAASAPPNVGATSWSAALDFKAGVVFEPNLIDGEGVWITQLTDRRAGTVSYQAVASATVVRDLHMVDGAMTTLQASLQPLSSTERVSVDWPRSRTVALLPSVNPLATFYDSSLFVTVIPGGWQSGNYGNAADLMEILGDQGERSDIRETFEYADPYPAAFERLIEGSVRYVVDDALPGTPARQFRGSLRTSQRVRSSSEAISLSMFAGPVRNFTINGRDAYVSQTGVGTEVIVRWEHPLEGPGTAYAVQFFRYEVQDGVTVRTFAGEVWTSATEMRVPPDIVTAGAIYRVLIGTTVGRADLPTAPYRFGSPEGYFETLSATFVP